MLMSEGMMAVLATLSSSPCQFPLGRRSSASHLSASACASELRCPGWVWLGLASRSLTSDEGSAILTSAGPLLVPPSRIGLPSESKQ